MSRLTARTQNGHAYLAGVKPNEQEVNSPYRNTLQCIMDCFERLTVIEDILYAEDGTERITIDELRDLISARSDGRVVVLPCKVGDTVWKIKAVFSYYSKPMEDRVDRIIISDKEILVCCTSGTKFSTDSIGKTVFLTREEAEAALKGASNGD